MLIIFLALLFSVFGLTTIMADCSTTHGTSLRIIPGIMSVLVFVILWITRKRLNPKKFVLAVLAFSIAFINLMGFIDWTLWATGLKPDNITLSRINYNTKIENVGFAELFVIGDQTNDFYLLIVKNDNGPEEKYHVSLEECVVSFIPNLPCSLLDDGSVKIDRSILSGRKFNYDLITKCKKVDDKIIIKVTGIKEPQYFKRQPILVNKSITLIPTKKSDINTPVQQIK
jgi:hypothetical protein